MFIKIVDIAEIGGLIYNDDRSLTIGSRQNGNIITNPRILKVLSTFPM